MGREIEVKEKFTFEGEGRRNNTGRSGGSSIQGSAGPVLSLLMTALVILLLVILMFLNGRLDKEESNYGERVRSEREVHVRG